MKRLFFLFCLLPLALNGANIDFRNLNTNHFTTNGFRVSLKGFPTNSHATNHITAIASNYFLTVSGGGITNLTTEGVDGASYVQAVSTPGSSFDNVQWTLMNWFLPTHVALAMPMAEVGYDSAGGHGVFHLFGRNTNAYDNIAGMNFWALPSAADWPFSSADTRLAVLRIKNPVALPAAGTDLQGGYLLWEVRYNQTAKDRRTNDTYANVFVADQFGNVGLGHLGAGSDLNPGIHPPAKVTVYASPSNMYPAFAVMDETQTNNWMIVTNGRVGIGTNGPQASLHITPELTGMNFFRVDDTNGALRAQIGTLGNGTAYLWMGNIIPNSTNITFGQNTANGTTYINTPENTPSHVIAFSMGGFTKLLMGTNYFAPNSGVNMDLGISGQLFNALRTQTASIGTNSSIYTVEIFSSDPDGALAVNSPHLYPAFKVETNGNASAVTFTTTGADPGFLLLRNSNLLGAVAFTHTGSQNSSNVFDFRGVSNVVAGQVLKVHSVVGNVVVLTNDTDSAGSGGFPLTADANAAGFTISNGVFLAALGSASAPSLSFFGDSDTGFYRSASDTVSLASGGAIQMSLGSAGVTIFQNDPLGFSQATGAADVWIDRTAPGVLDIYNGSVAWASNRIYGASVTDLLVMGHDQGHNWAFVRSLTNKLTFSVGTNWSFMINNSNAVVINNTIDVTATTTTNINKSAGCVRLAAGQQTYTITNSHATTASIIIPSVSSDDATLKSLAVIRGAGFFSLKGNTNATADCDLCWFIAAP